MFIGGGDFKRVENGKLFMLFMLLKFTVCEIEGVLFLLD
jgi:hypothetical protein